MEIVDERVTSFLRFFTQDLPWDIHELERIINSGVDVNQPLPDYSDPDDDDYSDLDDEENQTKLGRRALHIAAERGNEEAVQLLLDRGAEVDVRDVQRKTPLHLAARSGHHKTVELLLSKGAEVSAKDRKGITPIHEAAALRLFGKHVMVELLLNKGAKVSEEDFYKSTPLHKAALSGNHETVQLLLSKGAEVEAKDVYKTTPLHEAAQSGNHETVQLLLCKGADVAAKDGDRSTPLHIAAKSGNLGIVELLLNKGAEISAKDKVGNTPLHVAAKSGNHETVELLLRRGAEVSAKDEDGNTPLHKTSCKEVAELLIRNSASVLDTNRKNQSPLHTIYLYGFCQHITEVTKLFMDHGGEVNSQDVFVKSPLHYAVHNCDLESVLVLITKGANVNLQDDRGWTPLHCAVKSSVVNLEIVELLLDHGALRDVQDQWGNTVLHIINPCNVSIWKALVQKGGKIDVQNNYGETALHRAASAYKGEQLAAALLACGFSPSVKDIRGDTPCELTKPRSKTRYLMASYIHCSNLAGLQLCQDVKVDILLRKGEKEKAAKELEKVKVTNISDKLCIYVILTQATRPRYLLNEGAIEDIEAFFQSQDFCEQFPMYAVILEATFNRSKNSRYYLTRKATISMMSKTRKECCQQTPELPWEGVFQYLSMDDLKNIIHSEHIQ